jgi:hypothetical protein
MASSGDGSAEKKTHVGNACAIYRAVGNVEADFPPICRAGGGIKTEDQISDIVVWMESG